MLSSPSGQQYRGRADREGCLMSSCCRLFVILACVAALASCGDKSAGPDDQIKVILYDREPDWSPDGQWIAYASKGDGTPRVPSGLYTVGVANKKRYQLVDDGRSNDLHSPRWSPDGDWIVMSIRGDIYKVRGVGRDLTRLTTGGGHHNPGWSPDGERIIFDYAGDVYSMNADGDSLTLVVAEAESPDWFPDGKHLAVLMPDDLNNLQVACYSLSDGSVEFLTSQSADTKEILRVSPDGTRILYTVEIPNVQPSLWVVDVASHAFETITGSEGYSGTWSPEGCRIAYNYPVNGAIYVRNLKGNTRYQITPGLAIHSPEWDSLLIEIDDDFIP